MIEQKYSQHEKHSAVEVALREGMGARRAARASGVSVSQMQRWLREARDRPGEKLAEAQNEAEHRRRVLRILGGVG